MRTEPRANSLAGFWSDLPREGRMLLSVVAFEFIGSGLVLPFWVVYFHEIRGFSVDVVGLLLALLAGAGAVATIPGGVLIDRAGPRVAMVAVMVTTMVGELVVAFAGSLLVAIAGIVLVGSGLGLGWPTSQALVASVIPSEIRARYFGINFSLLNLGIGIGGIIGGLVVDVTNPVTFQALYVGDAVSFVPGLLLLTIGLRHVGGPEPVPDGTADLPVVSYLSVFRAPAMATMTLLAFLTSFIGYAQLDAGFPAYARLIGGVSTRSLGFAFAANTFVIVVLQLLVLNRIDGRRRTRVVAVMAAIWAASWLVLAASGIAPHTATATGSVVGFAVIFALGETLLQPTVPVIVNELAPEHLRGRYNALSAGAFQSAAILGPLVAGLMVGNGLHLAFIALLVAGCGLTGWLAVVRLEPQLDPVANGVTPPAPTLQS